MTQKRLLILDLDGVISDSMEETLMISALSFFTSEKEAMAKLSSSDIGRLVRERRGYVRPAKHFYLLWKWVTEYPEREFDQMSFEKIEELFVENVAQFYQKFLVTRKIWIEKRREEWLRLCPLYEGVKETWQSLREERDIFIVTTKDRLASETIAESHGLHYVKLYPQGSFQKKSEAILDIFAHYSAKHEKVSNALFVDDHPEHLSDVQEVMTPYLGKCMQALWGYSTGDVRFAALKDFAAIKGF